MRNWSKEPVFWFVEREEKTDHNTVLHVRDAVV